MLKRTTCSPYRRLGPIVFGSRIRFIPSIDGLSEPCLNKHSTTRGVHNIPTQHDRTESIPERSDDPVIKEGSLDTQSSDTTFQDEPGQTFTLTPRFQWRWRWHFQDSPNGRKRKNNGTAANTSDSAEINSSSGHYLPARTKQEQKRLDSVMGLLGTVTDSLRVPASPLERAIEENEWNPKRQPTREERQRLSFNPWAVMLAGNMRFDPASRTRAPGPLLMELGVVTNPIDGTPYLMPDDLANLETFDKRLQKGLRRLAMANVHRERGGGTVNILPYKVLVNELTNELVTWDQSTGRGRTKHGAVARRLLSKRWMERAEKINAYHEASKDYWKLKEKQGDVDDMTQKPDQPLDEGSLQWQPNIAERIHSIMKQRLILSIEHLGRKTDEPRNRPRKHFMCFEWPDSLYLDVISEARKSFAGSLASEGHEQQYIPPQDESINRTWTPDFSARHFEDADIWLPGSFFLHIGPPSTTLTALPHLRETQPDPATNTSEFPKVVPTPTISKFIPPMLLVSKTQRLPIFNLPALLGPKFEHPLHQILTLHGMLPPNRDDNLANANYLILIRGTAPGSHYIIQELWQLWRYAGGTDCLRSEPTTSTTATQGVTDEKVPTAKGNKAKMEQIKKYPLFKQFWDNFYKFLPGIKRPVQSDS